MCVGVNMYDIYVSTEGPKLAKTKQRPPPANITHTGWEMEGLPDDEHHQALYGYQGRDLYATTTATL